MGKPTGAICNLACAYCFYPTKEELYPGGLDCPVRFACNGECPKNRFRTAPDGEGG